MKEYKGYALFDEVQDRELRVRNLAVTMANIFEDNTVGNVITQRGGALLLGYFNAIGDLDKKMVTVKFRETMEERGYAAAL